MIHLTRLLAGLVNITLLVLSVILFGYIVRFIFDHFAIVSMIVMSSIVVGIIYMVGYDMLRMGE